MFSIKDWENLLTSTETIMSSIFLCAHFILYKVKIMCAKFHLKNTINQENIEGGHKPPTLEKPLKSPLFIGLAQSKNNSIKFF